MNNDELREAYEQCLPLISEYSTFVGQHQGLYEAYNALYNSDEFKTLTTAQQKTITNALRDFKLSGIAFNPEQQKRYGEISARLSELASKFGNKKLYTSRVKIGVLEISIILFRTNLLIHI